jgi:DNA-binding LacI/PurR family transcriptional regulator
VSGTQQHPSKKDAEQHVAQLMLDQLQPDMLFVQEQQVAAGAAAGLQAAFQLAPQQQQQV